MSDVKAVRGLKHVTPKCCYTCKHLEWLDGYQQCKRPNGPAFDTGDGSAMFTVCALWVDGSIYAAPSIMETKQ